MKTMSVIIGVFTEETQGKPERVRIHGDGLVLWKHGKAVLLEQWKS